jgi:hypothetical protein
LAIRNIIAYGAEKIHCAVGMEKMWYVVTGGSGTKDFLLYFLTARSITCAFAMDIQCSLRYWEYFQNYFLDPLSKTVRCKKGAVREVIGYWQRNCQ